MNPGRYFVPNMAMNSMMLRNGYSMSRGMGFFGRMMQGIRSFDWSKLLNGANKTLNVMNQTIPLIRQAKPMVGNVKSMIKLARAFGSETNSTRSINHANKIVKNDVTKEKNLMPKKEVIDSNYPSFFI